MNEVKIEFISEGFKEILNSPGVKAEVTRITEKIQGQANANLHSERSKGFAARVIKGYWGGGRWVGFVYTTDHATMVAQSEDKALSRAVY